jgi:hypothetical protein
MTKEKAIAEFQRDGMCACGEYAAGVIRFIDHSGQEVFCSSCGSCNDPILKAEWVRVGNQ